MTGVRRALLAVVLLVAAIGAFDFLAPHASVRIGLPLLRGFSGLHEARASIPGFEIAYLEGGQGEPLLLIHGFGANKDNFTFVARALTPRYRVLIPDLPGFGDSSKPEAAPYGIADQVERLRAFAAKLGIQRLHLGGSSMGGAIALAWAAKYPDEVASLWLLAPAATRAALDTDLARRYRETGEIALLARTPEEHAKVRDFVMSKPPFLPYSYARVLGEAAAADYALQSKIFAQLFDHEEPIETRATQVATPALIVWGDEDRALNPKGAEALHAVMPNSRVILMPGIGHLPMNEAILQSGRDYLAFRDSLPAR